MPDLLAHALIAYTLATVLSWRLDWLSPPYVTVAMAGAFVPDLVKVRLVLHAEVVAGVLGVPFDWSALHTLGGSAVSVLVGVVADALLSSPSGRSYPLFWPLARVNPPTPGLYLSTDPEPMLVAAAVAGAVFLVSRMRRRPGQ